jgi:hypothetical protein
MEYVELESKVVSDWWFGIKRIWRDGGTMAVFAWKAYGNARKTFVNITGIWTEYITNSNEKISGFHGGEYEECRLLCYAVWLL